MGLDLCGLTFVTLEHSTEEPFALFSLDLNQFDLLILVDKIMEAASRVLKKCGF